LDDLSPVVIIAGPTASGKTGLALKVAEQFNGEIVNADSMQVYHELSILTARPGPGETSRAPHHLFGCMSTAERCSAGKWLTMAQAAIKDIHQRGALPIVTGGTGLYLKALTQGLAAVPQVPPEMIANITAHLEDIGGEAFKAELAAVDPVTAERLPASDRQRLIRAAAVFAVTGRTLTDWQQEQPEAPGYSAKYLNIVLMPPREDMYAAIDARFDDMMSAGAMAEAEAFKELGLAGDLPASRAVGVVELVRVINGELDLDLAVEKAKTASRQLAKRQITWFKRQIHTDLLIPEKYSERNDEKIFSFICEFLLTRPD
jgi:tRNA dimethylallyltransferase